MPGQADRIDELLVGDPTLRLAAVRELPNRFAVAVADICRAVTVEGDVIGKLKTRSATTTSTFLSGETRKSCGFDRETTHSTSLSSIAIPQGAGTSREFLRSSPFGGNLPNGRNFQIGDENISLAVDRNGHRDSDAALRTFQQRRRLARLIEAIDFARRRIPRKDFAVTVESHARALCSAAAPIFLGAVKNFSIAPLLDDDDARQLEIGDVHRTIGGHGRLEWVVKLFGSQPERRTDKQHETRDSADTQTHESTLQT